MYCAVASRVLTTNSDIQTRGLLATWLQHAGFGREPRAKARSLADVGLMGAGLRAEILRALNEMRTLVASVDPHSAEQVLMTLLAMRSPDTYQHSLRVGLHSASLARALGVPPAQISIVRRAGLLHDIGKAAVPTRILRFRGRPAEDEVLALRLHAGIGEEILAAVPALASVALVVGATHERVDGAGYPNRLRGTDIPLWSRIISVADVYDAMTSVRPYQQPLAPAAANRELARVAGTQLDPEVVQAWISMTETRPC